MNESVSLFSKALNHFKTLAERVLPLTDSRAADDRSVYFIDDLFS